MQGNSVVKNTILPTFFGIQPKNNRKKHKKKRRGIIPRLFYIKRLDYILTTFAA